MTDVGTRAGLPGAGAQGAAPACSVLPVRLEAIRVEAGGRLLIDGLDLCIGARGRTLVLGPNGAGKTLLLRLLHGLVEPAAGRVHWSSRDPARVRRALAMVFQRPVLLRRSVAANLRYALAARGVPARERRLRALRTLEAVGLAARARQPARTLSGGEQQRLAIARAWALRPEILLLDEPTANLDPAAVRSLESLVEGIQSTGTKIVMTTHDLHQARRLADDVIFLHRGRCLEHGAAEDFFSRPASAEARAFLEGKLLE